MSKRVKQTSRMTIASTLVGGKHFCRLCSWAGKYNSGALTKHLKLFHSMSIQEYCLTVLGSSNICLCGCGETTGWEPRKGWFKEYVSGHNYRGKTKLTDESVARRVQKMMLSPEWKNSVFLPGNKSWNTGLTAMTDERLKKIGNKISSTYDKKSDDEKRLIAFKIGRTHSRNLKLGIIRCRFKDSTSAERAQWAKKAQLTKATRCAVQHTPGYKTGWFNSSKAGRVYYNSSYELEMMQLYDADDSVIFWNRCFFCIPYIHPDGKQRMYFPDFIVETSNFKVFVDEIKGILDKEAIAKAASAKEFLSYEGIQYRLFTKFKRNSSLTEVVA